MAAPTENLDDKSEVFESNIPVILETKVFQIEAHPGRV